MNYMNLAVKAAVKAEKTGNVPVGCVIVKDNKVVSTAYNKKNSSKISVYHAEILCIIKACEKLKKWYLDDCDMYVTLKPCAMCSAAIAESRIKKVFYLLDSDYEENLNKNYSNIEFIKVDNDCLYNKLITNFFEKLRK